MKVSVWVLALLTIFGQFGQPLELKAGAYEDLIVGVTDSVPVTECRTILSNLEATLTSASQYLFSSLDGRAFIQSATVVLPASWPDTCAPKPVASGSGDTQDITILPQGPTRGKIWTQQSSGCGQPGDQIYLGYETLVNKDENLARLLVKNFAMYRYGVFEEQGYDNDLIHPTCYYDDESKIYKVTGCSDLPVKDNGICTNPSTTYNKTQIMDEKARSSIMFAAEAPSVSMFCDEGTHDQYAPTKHNLICNKRSTYDIISNHPDFAINTIPNTHHTNEITNTAPRITYKKQNITRYILIIENTKDMIQRESWNYLRTAIRKWALFDLPRNTEVGVLLAHENGATKMLNILSLRNSNARDIISSNIPYTSGDSSQPAALHLALKDAITMLDDQTKYRSPARNVIVLIAPGMNPDPELQVLTKEARKAKIRIATINYPEVIRTQPLDSLAVDTDGVAYTVTEKKYNIDSSMLSTYFQLTNVLYNVIERFYSGNPSDLPMEIHRRKLTDDGRTSVTGSFVLDDYMGEPARFMLYTHNTESPLIRGLSLMSPSHQEYIIRSENMLTVKIISLAANITEPGTWTYTIERYAGNPQPHYVQVMATPHSRTVPVVRARFWTHTNQPGGPLILLAEVKRGSWPVLGAKVEATFTRTEMDDGTVGYSDTMELLDTGSGDPDITKGDGIYSRYFSAAPGGPGTYTFELTITDNGNTAYTWQTTSKDLADKPCCGSVVPTSSVQPLSPFQRVLPPITITITSEDMVKASQVIVGRVGDLRVQVKPEDMKALLTFTSPDMGGNRAARYEIKYATNLNDIVDNYETLAKRWEHATPHVLAAGSETTVTLDMTKEKQLLDKPLYFAMRAYPQMYSDALAAPVSNWVRVLVPSPPPPPTVPPTFVPNDQTIWPNQIHSVGIDPVAPSIAKSVNFGLEVILPIIVGVVILAIILSLYCYFCVIKRRSRNNNKKPIKNANALTTDKLNSPVTIVPGSPMHSPQNIPQHGYVNAQDEPDHHTVGVPINNYSFDDEPKKRYSLVHQQEQQLIEELKQQQLQHQQRELNTPSNTYAGLSVISNNSLQRNGGHTLSPYNSWSASQLLHEHERRHSPLDNMIPEDQMLAQHQDMLMNGSQIDHMSLNGQNIDHISMNGHQIANQIPDHYSQGGHAPPVPPLPVYNSNGYPVNYNIYGVHQPPQANQQNHPIYQSMQRNEPMAPYSASLQGSLSSVNSGEKKRRNVTMV